MNLESFTDGKIKFYYIVGALSLIIGSAMKFFIFRTDYVGNYVGVFFMCIGVVMVGRAYVAMTYDKSLDDFSQTMRHKLYSMSPLKFLNFKSPSAFVIVHSLLLYVLLAGIGSIYVYRNGYPNHMMPVEFYLNILFSVIVLALIAFFVIKYYLKKIEKMK